MRDAFLASLPVLRDVAARLEAEGASEADIRRRVSRERAWARYKQEGNVVTVIAPWNLPAREARMMTRLQDMLFGELIPYLYPGEPRRDIIDASLLHVLDEMIRVT